MWVNWIFDVVLNCISNNCVLLHALSFYLVLIHQLFVTFFCWSFLFVVLGVHVLYPEESIVFFT